MSFTSNNPRVQDGDLVLAWITRSHIKPVIISSSDPNGCINTRFGQFPFSSIIGSLYGSQIPSSTGQGFIHIIRPVPDRWTLSLPHRTQIVYTPDSSYIIQRLKVLAGSIVIEAGTGSGSFSHAFARVVGGKGKLFTYEFHESRYNDAKEEFRQHGLLEDNVVITHRDVCKNGFEIQSIDKLEASAVFLDLPCPWEAIPHLITQKNVVNRKRMVSICCFSPCIEQVTKTVLALRENGFQRIEMVEVQAKKWEAHKEMIKDIDEAVERLRDIKKRRAEGLALRNARIESEKRKLSCIENDSEQSPDLKKIAYDDDINGNESKSKSYNPWGKGVARIKEGDERFNWTDVSRTETEIKTHTSYLTFAILPPLLA